MLNLHREPAADAPRGRVAVAMSGGVDSSVAAALLVEQGWDVVGVHMKLHDIPDEQRREKSCCSLDDALDARQVCARLGIPFYVLDFQERFRERVIDYFVDAYRAGRTPNPCVMCNQSVKNAALLEEVRAFGCEYLATGHYAARRRNPATGDWELVRPRDRRKDQTYFLFSTPRAELPWLLYPLADYEKAQTRAVAERHAFLTWDKPDSMEVCFVPRDYREFLRGRMGSEPALPGPFVDRAGRELGTHQGLPFYTVGQRRGVGVQGAGPLYVVALRPGRNEVVLGPESELYSPGAEVRRVNWVSREAIAVPIEADVKVRYAHEGTRASIEPAPLDGDPTAVRVRFAEPVRAVTPGQAAVFYAGDVLLGGGWIEAPLG
jgi:tRNA-uridine 2-sulfurtransferase